VNLDTNRQHSIVLANSHYPILKPPVGGGLSAEKYIRITKTSRATATRDLAELTAKQALKKTGQLKGTRYHLNLGH